MTANERSALAVGAATLLAALAGCGGAAGGPDEPSQPSERRAAIPPGVQRDVHETFHRLPRSCSRRRADEAVLTRTTQTFLTLYRRYPPERFALTIDDESGDMLSAILVLRYELATCSPRHAASIDPVLPPAIRRGLSPLRGAQSPGGVKSRGP